METILILLNFLMCGIVLKLSLVHPGAAIYTVYIPDLNQYGPRICMLRSWPSRLVGFLHHLQPPKDYVLGFKVGWGSRCFHTVGMHFAIDIVALDRKGKVVGIINGLRPGMRRIKLPKGTRTVLEFAAGQALIPVKLDSQLQFI